MGDIHSGSRVGFPKHQMYSSVLRQHRKELTFLYEEMKVENSSVRLSIRKWLPPWTSSERSSLDQHRQKGTRRSRHIILLKEDVGVNFKKWYPCGMSRNRHLEERRGGSQFYTGKTEAEDRIHFSGWDSQATVQARHWRQLSHGERRVGQGRQRTWHSWKECPAISPHWNPAKFIIPNGTWRYLTLQFSLLTVSLTRIWAPWRQGLLYSMLYLHT